MLTLGSLLSQLGTRPDLESLLASFVPPPRFADKRFESYHPAHPTQAEARDRLRGFADERWSSPRPRLDLSALLPRRRRRVGRGVYLDGGFGVGKTHLLAALWHVAPEPKWYLSFDELMYFVGLYGSRAAGSFAGARLIAVDEWELDDPGNLKMALAFLRSTLGAGSDLAVTSNTLPLELGAGRFSQKDFRAEIEELSGAFEVVRVEGEDYRHRSFEARPGLDVYATASAIAAERERAGPGTLITPFPALMEALSEVHPIRFREFADRVERLVVEEVGRIDGLPAALRWVHFVDSIYDAGVGLTASGVAPLGELFPRDAFQGPYAKKLSRCLSRMEEMLGESRAEGLGR